MLRYMTAGESHGPGLTAIIEGLPSGLEVSRHFINEELSRRQMGVGRGGRMKIEKDEIEIIAGVRAGKTLGSPISFLIKNRDWENWLEVMSSEETERKPEKITKPRPGHADLAGIFKMNFDDIRNVLERASARETAARVAVGAFAKLLLNELDIKILSHVVRIGSCSTSLKVSPKPSELSKIDLSPVRCFDKKAETEMLKEIEAASLAKDSLGGIFEVLVYGCPPGLGSYISWDRRLDGRLSRAIVSIPAIKGVEFGEGFKISGLYGSKAHDEIFYDGSKGFYRKTNRAGGLEGGMTNGEPILIRAAMKPIPTLSKPLKTVDIVTKKLVSALKERADVCAVPAAAVVGEAVTAFEIANALIEKFGGDSILELKRNYEGYLKQIADACPPLAGQIADSKKRVRSGLRIKE
ncbi:chorismate synthase [Candidatus Oleimmundimicrobium sp.]|uniref:chorismate synthase n=1 Tax=Candidatus Oleimmundimicrobium sp. TaxID=3060597 RepID=UPI00271A4A5F|nr:chorismate synthase [Candidatus Oleimmundimicrobium sp.]MDO8886430.1 chorismate synthase [Candidatus Oleimmundimicrobium sp.]